MPNDAIQWTPEPNSKPFLSTISYLRLRVLMGGSLLIVCTFLMDWMNRTAQGTLMVLLLTGCFAEILWRRKRLKQVQPSQDNTGNHPEKPARLICTGHPADLQSLRGITDTFFAPLIFVRLHSFSQEQHGTWIRRPWIIWLIAVRILGWPLWMWITGQFALWALPIILQTRHPRYYRLVPGQLDIMEFRWWSVKGRIVDTICLRTAQIICRCHEQKLVIREPDSRIPPKAINLYGLRDPTAFVKGVFQAALCQDESPKMPEDSLLG